MNTTLDREILDRVGEGFRRVGLTFPHLVGLIRKVEPQVDRRVPTMGIFASGRLLINPEFTRGLSDRDLVFVLTHELFHLTLRTHERSPGTDPARFNQAHDFIINDLLREELQYDDIPAGGLDWRGARLMSAEKILGEMDKHPDLHRSGNQAWSSPCECDGPGGDVLDGEREGQMFPQEERAGREARAREMGDEAARAVSLKALMDSMSGRGSQAGGQHESVAALRGLYRPPWEQALQIWLESVAPGERSYARPSRRGADRRDVVLPGRKREGWTLQVILDTSGSMVQEIPRALGAIADFCEAVGVDRIRLVQCDTEVGRDEILSPLELARWQVTGYGGSDLTPAMQRLAEDNETTAAVVITDGDIDYPQKPVPYTVLWVLPPWKSPQEFTPRYGRVLAMSLK